MTVTAAATAAAFGCSPAAPWIACGSALVALACLAATIALTGQNRRERQRDFGARLQFMRAALDRIEHALAAQAAPPAAPTSGEEAAP